MNENKRHDHNTAVSTQLSRAVEHAGLTFHKQVPNLVAGKRRKDFDDPVRDQVILLLADRIPGVSGIRASAPAESGNTTRATSPRRHVPLRVVPAVFEDALFHQRSGRAVSQRRKE